MVDRQDKGQEDGQEELDALLIGALYGELTPAEEARLAAHLESHPQDRTALADLTRAREVVHESRILKTQAEPPQSISAMLLQEAARRAPAQRERSEGWFARFVQSFMSHPAMAAAAMLVVVVGFAALVSRRGGDQFAESTAPAAGSAQLAAEQAPAPEPELDDSSFVATPTAHKADEQAAPAGGAGPEVGTDQYPVRLEEGLVEGEAKRERTLDAPARKAPRTTGGLPEPGRTAVSKPTPRPSAPKGATRAPSGIEVRTVEPAPKDFAAAPAKEKKAQVARSAEAGDEGLGKVGVGGSGASSRSQFAEPPPPPAPAPATAAPAPRSPAPVAAAPKAPAPVAAAPERSRDDRPAESAAEEPRAEPAEDKPADPQLAWARQQHAALVTQVRAGNCRSAAALAVRLSNRAPAYYAQHVATDRAVKSCLAYINAERERDAEERAARARASGVKPADK